jgi:CheY-like chemotaxis protein
LPRVLLVEDDETSREMLSLRLELNGYEVEHAGDGQAALNCAAATPPDLILLDMNLPILDGWHVSRELKKHPATSQVPIIGVSAHAMSGDRERALTAGCDEYETKPVDWSRLAPKMSALLERKS